jgi:hypothetical protein
MTRNDMLFIIIVTLSLALTIFIVLGPILAGMRAAIGELLSTNNPALFLIFLALVGIGLYAQLPH